MPIKFYNDNAQNLAEQYLSRSFEDVHANWSEHLGPILDKENARVLDVGAGAGRDARYLALKGQDKNINITAVEPAELMALLGKQQTQALNVDWVDDSLPDLAKVTRKEISYDLILLSAVWMHIPASQRARSLRKLGNLLKPGGKIVISLRYQSATAPVEPKRVMYEVSADGLVSMAKNLGLVQLQQTDVEQDKLGRADISWQTVVLQLPDDGLGALPLLRNIIINDNKASTYKLALLRVLLRIADGHAGSAKRCEDSNVSIPLGLVSLYWCHQFKPLIDSFKIRQNSDPNKGMGFVKANGWQQLTSRVADDYAIGNLFIGEDAKALYRTLSQSAQTIRDMPCKYISLPNSDTQIFHVNYSSVRANDSLFLDGQSLSLWGEFILPESIWLALTRYACWIEPVLINEWVNVMQYYKGNEAFGREDLRAALNWADPKRSTEKVRQRVESLKGTTQTPICVWTQKQLRKDYEIDHCMPFSRWPNNDLWNLLPSTREANGKKSDRLPTASRLSQAQDIISHWWQQAWLEEGASKEIFFAQANLALPDLDASNRSIDDLFQAMALQRDRLREMQQLREW